MSLAAVRARVRQPSPPRINLRDTVHSVCRGDPATSATGRRRWKRTRRYNRIAAELDRTIRTAECRRRGPASAAVSYYRCVCGKGHGDESASDRTSRPLTELRSAVPERTSDPHDHGVTRFGYDASRVFAAGGPMIGDGRSYGMNLPSNRCSRYGRRSFGWRNAGRAPSGSSRKRRMRSSLCERGPSS